MEPQSVAVAFGAATAMAAAVAGLVFLRYWTRTGDRLFAYFAASFWLMAGNRVALVVVGDAHEASTLLYLVRLAAFSLILLGVVEKNVVRRPRGGVGAR